MITPHPESKLSNSRLAQRLPAFADQFWWPFVAVLAAAVLLGLFFRALGLDVGFFRGESGFYLAFSAATPEMQRNFISHFVLKTYNGHFNPLIFWLEFQQAKLFQTHAALWFWRQMFVLSMLGCSVGWLAFQAFRAGGGARVRSSIAGASVAVVFIAQPIFLDLAMYPLMAFQFICLTLMAVSAICLMRFVASRKTQDLCGFLFASYAAMHASGVGAAISAAALATAAALVLIFHFDKMPRAGKTKPALIAIAVAAVLTAGHGLLMVAGDSSTPGSDAVIIALENRSLMADFHRELPIKPPLSAGQNLVRFGALFEGVVDSSIRSLWANGGYVWPRLDVAKIQAVYGFGTLLVFVGLVVGFLARYFRQRNSADLVAFALTVFSLSCLVIYAGLIVFRLRAEPDDAVLLSYFVGARYIIFPVFFLVLFGIGLILRAVSNFPFATPSIFIIIAVSALIAEAVFAKTYLPSVWPGLTLNHQRAWNAVVREARQKIEKGDDIDDVDLSKLGDGFPVSLKSMQFVLERQIGCSGCAKFASP